MNPKESALRERARALGANHIGIAPAVLPEISEGGPKAYHAWLEQGMHGQMAYMAREPEGRSEITRWYPEAQSVILCAFSYHDGAPRPETTSSEGRLARYSLPPDYHDELKSRMRRLLADFCEIFPHGDGRVFVDTSPVLERLYARYAGMGWVGKNTMILSKDIGSFFLLAGIAVNHTLAYDNPVEPHCGTCTRCIDNCPTNAFPQPNVLDASRCIANFTVEQRKDPIPEKFRAGHHDWLFGCDVCQDACPWNKFSVKSSVFSPQLPHNLDLEALVRLTPEDFNKTYKGTPLRRTGHTALVRNALLVMGNSGDTRHKKTLQELSTHENPMIAEQARWSLARLNSPNGAA